MPLNTPDPAAQAAAQAALVRAAASSQHRQPSWMTAQPPAGGGAGSAPLRQVLAAAAVPRHSPRQQLGATAAAAAAVALRPGSHLQLHNLAQPPQALGAWGQLLQSPVASPGRGGNGGGHGAAPSTVAARHMDFSSQAVNGVSAARGLVRPVAAAPTSCSLPMSAFQAPAGQQGGAQAAAATEWPTAATATPSTAALDLLRLQSANGAGAVQTASGGRRQPAARPAAPAPAAGGGQQQRQQPPRPRAPRRPRRRPLPARRSGAFDVEELPVSSSEDEAGPPAAGRGPALPPRQPAAGGFLAAQPIPAQHAAAGLFDREALPVSSSDDEAAGSRRHPTFERETLGLLEDDNESAGAVPADAAAAALILNELSNDRTSLPLPADGHRRGSPAKQPPGKIVFDREAFEDSDSGGTITDSEGLGFGAAAPSASAYSPASSGPLRRSARGQAAAGNRKLAAGKAAPAKLRSAAAAAAKQPQRQPAPAAGQHPAVLPSRRGQRRGRGAAVLAAAAAQPAALPDLVGAPPAELAWAPAAVLHPPSDSAPNGAAGGNPAASAPGGAAAAAAASKLPRANASGAAAAQCVAAAGQGQASGQAAPAPPRQAPPPAAALQEAPPAAAQAAKDQPALSGVPPPEAEANSAAAAAAPGAAGAAPLAARPWSLQEDRTILKELMMRFKGQPPPDAALQAIAGQLGVGSTACSLAGVRGRLEYLTAEFKKRKKAA